MDATQARPAHRTASRCPLTAALRQFLANADELDTDGAMMRLPIPHRFWKTLRDRGLIALDTPLPAGVTS